MDWELVHSVDEVIMGQLNGLDANSTSALGHFPGWARKWFPRGETPHLADTFINHFMKVDKDFPNDFPLEG